MSIFIPISKKDSTKECANLWTVALISHDSKVMLKILHARLQNYAKEELPDVQDGFRKGKVARDQIEHLLDHRESKGIPENIYLCFWEFQKTSISTML